MSDSSASGAGGACNRGARPGVVAARADVIARTSYGRLLALLAARTCDITAAEDAIADAFERALRTWPERGIPANPDAWLLTVARHRLRDHWRSGEVSRTVSLEPLRHAPAVLHETDLDALPDRRLELMLVCGHPAIDPAMRAPLMLNTVLGFTAAQIGHSFAIPATTMGTRLTRVKRRIKVGRIPFEIPDRSVLPARLHAVLEAVYAAYVIDWSTTGRQERDLPPQAIELAEILAGLVPDDAEARGLAALVELSAARRHARTDDAGRFVPLDEQDPARWDARLVERAHMHLRAAHAQHTLGRFQLEAAIQAVHCARATDRPSDLAALARLHLTMHRIAPSLGNSVALAAVVGQVEGPEAGLLLLDELGDVFEAAAARFQPAWATRAHLLAR
ncbi:RNA polymerase sigma factor [Agilicoccus flavus]|uniref:RNA polymerase sigma factor n=1 Tax=Agilicoccus flavus TaxID=2775968 RepID=UPI001CF6CBCE|nr:DUF6596 domain-containing protein [Agilicoccus flavus]